MTILVTGAAGFIGFHVCQQLLQQGHRVLALDCLNDYYDVSLKKARLASFNDSKNFEFFQIDLSNREQTLNFFKEHPEITHVIHLAAQAGVRYSLTHPFAYADANLIGHLSILEGCRALPNLHHMVYASSSSVYGSNKKIPFAVEDRTDHPISLYAATKKSCELMSDCYAHLYNFSITGLRYFTVYGPWGRPDMSAFIFTKAILEDQEFAVYNRGHMRRNFTYIDDIARGTVDCLLHISNLEKPRHLVYNLGNDRSEKLMDFVHTLEDIIGKTARMRLEDMQPGDVPETLADITKTTQDFGFKPTINIQEGLVNFVNWYRDYYHK